MPAPLHTIKSRSNCIDFNPENERTAVDGTISSIFYYIYIILKEKY